MQQFMQDEKLIVGLLLVVSLVAVAVRRWRLPYTVALVGAGLAVSLWQPVQIRVMPELILTLFVPPLVFEAAFHLDLAEVRRNLPVLLLLAVPGVVVTTLMVGALLGVSTPLGLPLALVFGSLIAATDPVAVLAVFRRLGAPRRLSVLVEGESLLNDGTAIAVFGIVLAMALGQGFSLAGSASHFVSVAVGGVVVGLSLGWLISALIAHIDDYFIETTLTTVLAFGAYLVAEQFHFSGVLAVVGAGLVNGNLGSRGMSPTTRVVLVSFWEYLAFVATSLVFLLIGLQVDLPALIAAWQPIAAAVLAVMAARTIVVYGLGWVANRLGERVPLRWQHVLNWGGLRGGISLALALSLPASLGAGGRLLQTMAFGVVLFTLMVQATTIGPLLHRLRLITHSEAQADYELRRGRLMAIHAAGRYLEKAHLEGLLSDYAWRVLKPTLTERAVRAGKSLAQLLEENPSLRVEELMAAKRELLLAERSAIVGLRQGGEISAEATEMLVAEVDAALEAEDLGEGDAPAQADEIGAPSGAPPAA